MRSVAVLLSSLILSSCATHAPAPNSGADTKRNVCTDGIIALRFKEDSAALMPKIAKELEWPARATWECPNITLKVIGLPSPSETNLQGRRSHSLAQVLRGFGTPEPSFEFGNAEDQALPVLEILARP